MARTGPIGHAARVRLELVDELEEFIQHGRLWTPADLQAMIDRLEAEALEHDDQFAHQLGRFLTSVLIRMQIGDVSTHLAVDIEGIVYPRLWKLMEAVRDGMPDGELRTRIEVMKRRLSRLFADEALNDV
jgi:hypothetical protein